MAGAAVLITALLFFSACAATLGPAYAVEQQQLELRYVARGPRLELRATFRLKNTGNRELSSVELSLPDDKTNGRQNLRIEVEGRGVAPQTLTDGAPQRVRIPFDSPWPLKQKRKLVISYELVAADAQDPQDALGQEAFYLPQGGWYPALHAPAGPLGQGGEPPKKWELLIRVPEGFLAHASGLERGRRNLSGELTYRFEQRESDLAPFAVLGRYREEQVSMGDAAVIFWTIEPLPPDQSRKAAERLAATVKAFENAFGPRNGGHSPVWVVQWWKAGGVDLPDVAFYAGASPADEASLSSIEFELANTWFTHMASPRPDAQFLQNALPHYAIRAAAEAWGDAADRAKAIALLREKYSSHRREGKEKPLTSIGEADPAWQQELRSVKAELFLFALEDECGREHLQRALARVIHARRGAHWGLSDLRSALEAETGKNLGEFFRLWLNQPGLPADFQARYGDEAGRD